MTPRFTFRAQYEGSMCPADCGHRIHPGDLVKYDEYDDLMHAECTPERDPTTLAPGEVVCGVCWITPCRCIE